MANHLVIPCYNESERLPSARILGFLNRYPDWTAIFVDDGSRDATLQTLEELHDSNPYQVVVLKLKQNSGKAEAVRAGMRFGLEVLDSERIGFADADLAAPLEEVLHLEQAMQRHPAAICALGIRLQLLGHDIRRKKHRFFIGRAFSRLASHVLGVPCRDTQCGMKLFQNNEALHQALRAPFTSRWVFDVELIKRLLICHETGLSAEELLWEQPLDFWEEISGSKLRMRDFVIAALDLVRIAGQREIPPEPADRNDPIVVALSQPAEQYKRAA
jgi:glycosyltransferase involved in cell wall biosynthesis